MKLLLDDLRDVNMDVNIVGWYQSSVCGTFADKSLIEAQYAFQVKDSNTCVILYDPLMSTRGSVAFRALRLTGKFMQLYAANGRKLTMTQSADNKISFNDIFEELPVTVKNSGLASAWLQDAQVQHGSHHEFDALNIHANQYVEQTLDLLNAALDAQSQESYRWGRYQQQATRQHQLIANHIQRNKTANQKRIDAGQAPLPEENVASLYRTLVEPSQLDSMLIQRQMATYCEQINDAAVSTLPKYHYSRELQSHN